MTAQPVTRLSANSPLHTTPTSYFFPIAPTPPPPNNTHSLRDALPTSEKPHIQQRWKDYLPLHESPFRDEVAEVLSEINRDRNSTRLNSSHVSISYAVFCLKKKS